MNEYPLTPIDPMGLPASVEFLIFFKTLGFVLHMIPMNIWYIGVLLSTICISFGKGHFRTVGIRLISVMPILLALGINFGILPLLFTQVLFYPQYYTAGILIAVPWFSVIVLLLFAYYGVYLYAHQVKQGSITLLGYGAGWMSSVIFLIIGFMFTNNFSLMTNPTEWMNIFSRTTIAGAVSGIALNLGDPTLFPRYLLMIGIAITTTAVWIVVDARFSRVQQSTDYCKYVNKFSSTLYTIGLIWMFGSGSWYILGALSDQIFNQAMQTSWVKIIFGLAGFSAIVPWLWLIVKSNFESPSSVWVIVCLQLIVIVSNAISRQWVQIAEIERFMPLSRDPVNWQWSPLIVFLVLFISSLFVIAWMVRRIVKLPPQRTTPV